MTARFVANLLILPDFGAGLTDLVLDEALARVFPAADLADFVDLGLLRIFAAL